MSDKYILDGKTPVVEPDLLKWSRWFGEHNNRRVGDTRVFGSRVSTVFLGLDHSFGDGPPLLFETMVFGGSLDGEMVRYSTWDQAEVGHKAMVLRIAKPFGITTLPTKQITTSPRATVTMSFDDTEEPWITNVREPKEGV